MAGPVDPRLFKRARPVRIYLLAAILVGAALAAVVVAQAWTLSSAIGSIFQGHRADRRIDGALTALPWLVIIFGARAGLSWLSGVLAHRAAAAVKSQLRKDLLRSRLSVAGTETTPTGSFINLLTQGLDALDGYFGRYLPQLVLAVIVPVVVGVAIWSADPVSAIVVACTLPLIPVFMILIGLMTQSRVRRRWKIQSRLAHHFADLIAGLPTLQVFGRAQAQAEGLRRTGERHRAETITTLRISFLSALVLEVLASLSVALVAVGIGLRVVDGGLTLTIGLFVLILAPEAYLPVRQVGVHYHDAADGMAAAEQAFAQIDTADEVRPTGTLAAPDLREATIRLEDVTLTYPGRGKPVLDHFNLEILPGEVVALLGPSGIGKSTVLQLLLGLRRPDSGQVLIGDRLLDDLDLAEWRTRLAWVAQNPALLPGTIADNISFGRHVLGAGSADRPFDRLRERSQVRAALDAAGAADVDQDRRVGEQGEGLSAGEIRRVALARALLRISHGGGQLLILDEPTAGLDADTEQSAIDGLRRAGVGAVIVTHRPAIAALADQTYRLGTETRIPEPVLR